MKRFLTILLALCLLALPALSETADYTRPDTLFTVTYYTHPTAGFTVPCPDGWLVVDSSNLDAVLEETSDTSHPYAYLRSSFSPSAESIRTYQIVLMLDPATQTNINFVPQDIGVHLDAQTFASTQLPQVLSQLLAQFPGAEALNEASVVTLGDNEYATISLSYSILGQNLILSQYYIMNGNNLITITFTIHKDILENNLETMESLLSDILADVSFAAE